MINPGGMETQKENWFLIVQLARYVIIICRDHET